MHQPNPVRLLRALVCASLVWSAAGCGDDPSEDPIVQPEPTPDVEAPPPILTVESQALALTPTEFNNTVRDLLGMPMNPAAWPKPPAIAARLAPQRGERKGVFGLQAVEAPPWPWTFPAETGVEHFEGMADGQQPSPYAVEELQKAAMHFASFALVSPVFFACDDWATLTGEAQTGCGWASIERFAQRAWRRPLSTAERDRLQAFWQANLAGGPADEAVVLTAAGVLLSPAFQYRLEQGDADRTQGDAIPLTGWEMASKLSYFLWDSMPDPALFAAAAQGELDTTAGVETQVRRMLDDPRARSAVVHFHNQWLGTTRVHGISPARRAYGPLFGLAPEPPLDTTGDGQWPQILLPIRHSMEAETYLFLESTVFDGAGTLAALLTESRGFMSDYTAPLYGEGAVALDGPSVTWSFGLIKNSLGETNGMSLYPTRFDESERAGVLTLPSVLALGSYAVHPAPILRGKMILERLACQDFGTPPPGASAAAPPDIEDADNTNRERTDTATSAVECAGCHDTMNPPGFAFEHYDSLGRWRAEDNGKVVDAAGSFTLWSGESFTFEDGVELAHQLSTSPRVRDCYVMRWARYATGIQLKEADEVLAPLQQAFQQDDNIANLLVAIAASDFFRHRRAGGQP